MILVTGGAGFIGSNIVEALVARGDEVRVIDDFSNGLRSNIEDLGGDVDLLECDIRDSDAVARAMVGVDGVLHLAALGSVPRSIDDPATSHAVNVNGTLNVLIAARDAGVRRLVYSSSSSVYGANPALPKVETLPTAPVSPYAASKLAAENYTRVFAGIYGLETVSLRYFNVFGPRQRPDSAYAAVIPAFMHCALAATSASIDGDGEQTRDFTYVANVVRANLLALEAGAEVVGDVFNVACGERYSLLDILAAIEDASGKRVERVHGPPRQGDVRDSLADISKAEKSLGYSPVVSFGDGMGLTWQAFALRHEGFPA
jgi:nucleoside-diphosphate-sugar epimerase